MKENWNIDRYRNKFEPDEQWELKRKFMETHKHRFSRERVVCLAQVLVNMEFLGAKYPVETMDTVIELSKDIIEGFREKQKARLQRTFVEASDAASSKVKGFRSTSTFKCQIEKNTSESNARYFMNAILSSNLKNIAEDDNKELSERGTTQLNPPSTDCIKNGNNECPKKRKKKKETVSAEKLPLKNIAEDDNNESSKKRKRKKETATAEKLPLKNIAEDDNNESSKKRKRKKETATSEKLSLKNIAEDDNNESSKKRKRKKETLTAEKLSLKNAENDECIITQNDSEACEKQETFVQPASRKWTSQKGPMAKDTKFCNNYVRNSKKKIKKHAKNKSNPEPSYRIIIETSARLSSVDLKVKSFFLKHQALWQSVLYLGGREIVCSLHENEKMSQKGVFELAFPILEKTHYQMVITDKDTICISIDHFIGQEGDIRQAQAENSVRTTITKDVMEGKQNKSYDLSENGAFEVLSKEKSVAAQPVNSAAMKMMKKMGWTEGTGLGAKKQGIVEPIKADVIVGRKGIGYDGSAGKGSFAKIIRRYLNNYISSFSVHTIIFSNEFSTDQRKQIHSIANKMGLHSKSVGKEPNRQLTVRRSRRKRPLVELLNELIESQGEDTLFEKLYLISPAE